MNKLVVCVMGQDNAHDLNICLNSVCGVDAIVYCDGGSSDDSVEVADQHGAKVIVQDYSQVDPLMNSKQRNFYLGYLKEHYAGWWCLCLDADEVVCDGGIEHIRDKLNKYDKFPEVVSPRMRHLQGDFLHEDAVSEVHHVPNRFFKVSDDLSYPEGEHVILKKGDSQESFRGSAVFPELVVWHLAYAPMGHVKKRYEKNLEHSNVHSKGFLEGWYRAHLFGNYPKKRLDPRDLPTPLLEAYHIPKDELYFAGRDVEPKHFFMVKQWNSLLRPTSVYDLGCGRGPYLSAWNLLGVYSCGVELSRWASERPVWGVSSSQIMVGDVLDLKGEKVWDLVTLIDILEHISEDLVPVAIRNAVGCARRYVLASIPFEGDPNLYNDPTHKVFKPREWWVEQFVKQGLKEVEVPEDWLYRNQLLLFEVLDGNA